MAHSLLRMLTTLLDNAVRFTPNHRKVSLVAEETDNHTMSIAISDEGEPLSEAERQALMSEEINREPAWDGTHARRLGYRYCLAVLNSHGGTLDIRADEKEGNTVVIALPLVASPA